jgi:hypothetical protein
MLDFQVLLSCLDAPLIFAYRKTTVDVYLCCLLLGLNFGVSLSDSTFLTWISSFMCFLLDSYRLWGKDFRRSIGRWLNDMFTQVRLLVFFSGLTQTTLLSCKRCNYPQWGKQMCQKGQHTLGSISFCIYRTVHGQSFNCMVLPHGAPWNFFCNSCYIVLTRWV